MKQWYVAYTQPAKEQVAQHHLQEQGFEVYLPRFKKIRRHARKVDEVITPLFPRYLFVALDLAVDRWRSVNGTRGVVSLLMAEDRPVFVAAPLIAHLQQQENTAGIVPLSTLTAFTQGAPVRIVEGIFEGQTAIFERLDEKQRAQLLLTFLGRTMPVAVPAYVIEAA
jgi:Transcription antiterminator